MDKTFEHYKKVLDDLIAENEFFRFYFQSPYMLMDRDNGLMREDYNCGNHNIEMFFGVTRGCIVDADCDEVVKFNLDTADENACSYECDVYTAAEMCNLNSCFTRARYIGTYVKTLYTYPACNFILEEDEEFSEFQFRERIEKDAPTKCEVTIRVPLYAYEKAQNIGFNSNNIEDEDELIATSHNSPLLERSEEIAASFVHEYGETVYQELSDFLTEWNINDIHYGNIGWIGKRFVLVDYAGYHNS